MAIKFEQYLQHFERIDQLIRLKCTGTPEALAQKLKISRSTLYRHIDIMRTMGAPIVYSLTKESFIYEYPVQLNLGFQPQKSTCKLHSSSDLPLSSKYRL